MGRRHSPRRDSNHTLIVNQLQKFGATVADLAAVGGGIPDILVGWNGRNYLFEIKTDDGSLNSKQVAFANGWQGQVTTIRSTADALLIILADED